MGPNAKAISLSAGGRERVERRRAIVWKGSSRYSVQKQTRLPSMLCWLCMSTIFVGLGTGTPALIIVGRIRIGESISVC
jgi:hypothetical protein